MELRQYFLLFWKWAWLIALAVIIAASASYYASKSATPLYSTKTTLMVGRGTDDPNPEFYELNTSRFLANTYIELVKREPVLQGAIDSLGLDMNWWGLAGRVSAKKVPDTQLMEISVIDNDPYRAKVLSDAIANQLIIQSPADPSDIDQEQVLFSQNQILDLQNRIEDGQAELDQISNELSAASSARQIDNLQNKKALLESKISDWQDTYAQLLLVIQGGDINTLRIVEEAAVPTHPFSPKVLTNVLTASAIAAVLAIAGAVLIEYLDDSIKSPEEVKQIADLPTLGGITRIEGNNYDDKLVTAHTPLLPISEAFRVLRTNIQFSFVDNPPKSISITSPGPSEGKSIILANLAVAIAQSGQKVILVDTDLRRPVLHKIFGLPNRHGLSEIVINPESNIKDFIQDTSIDGLQILTSGSLPPNPAELLDSNSMKSIIQETESYADIILFDSPPTLVVADAAIIGSKVDGVIILCDMGRTRSKDLKRTVEELHRGRANVVGVVLNRVSIKASGYYYNYYYYYHYYYGEKEDARSSRGRSKRNGKELLPSFITRVFNKSSDDKQDVKFNEEKI